jgi:hypothetical protein
MPESKSKACTPWTPGCSTLPRMVSQPTSLGNQAPIQSQEPPLSQVVVLCQGPELTNLVVNKVGPVLEILGPLLVFDPINPPSLGCHLWSKPGLLEDCQLSHCSGCWRQESQQLGITYNNLIYVETYQAKQTAWQATQSIKYTTTNKIIKK